MLQCFPAEEGGGGGGNRVRSMKHEGVGDGRGEEMREEIA